MVALETDQERNHIKEPRKKYHKTILSLMHNKKHMLNRLASVKHLTVLLCMPFLKHEAFNEVDKMPKEYLTKPKLEYAVKRTINERPNNI